MDFTVIYELTPAGFPAYVPDLPGCVAAGASRTEDERLIRSAVKMHLDAMRDDRERVPRPRASAGTVTVAGER